jgi:hypothetical protein
LLPTVKVPGAVWKYSYCLTSLRLDVTMIPCAADDVNLQKKKAKNLCKIIKVLKCMVVLNRKQ